MLNPIVVAENAIARSTPVVASAAARNPIFAAVMVVSVTSLAAWKYGELVVGSYKRSPSIGEMLRTTKRMIHRATAEVAEATAPTVAEAQAETAEVAEATAPTVAEAQAETADLAEAAPKPPATPLKEVKAAALKVATPKKAARNGAAPAAKAA